MLTLRFPHHGPQGPQNHFWGACVVINPCQVLMGGGLQSPHAHWELPSQTLIGLMQVAEG